MLSAKDIIEKRGKSGIEIPSFGIKDFEPNGTSEQFHEIQNSLLEIKNVISQERVKLLNTLSQAVWRSELKLAEVTQQIGSYWSYIGHKVEQKLYIYPEEAVYLLEIGCIQILYNDVPLSIQRAYFVLLNPENNITLEKYRVYSQLSSNGYKVLRHSSQNTITKYEKQLEVHKIGLKLKDYHSLTQTIKRQQHTGEQSLEQNKKLKVCETKTCPVIDRKDGDSFNSLKKVQVIQPYISNSDTNLTFDYDVYSEKLDKPFKKSCLQLPNFRIIVHRGQDTIPDVQEFCKLSRKYKDEVPVIHAIVFFDCIIFYKIDPVILPGPL